jgi:hypothetical protein
VPGPTTFIQTLTDEDSMAIGLQSMKPASAAVGSRVADDADDIAQDRNGAVATVPDIAVNGVRSPANPNGEIRYPGRGKFRMNYAKPKAPESAPKVDETRIDVPPQRPVIDGFPSPERDAGVVAARAKFEGTRAKYVEARKARLTTAEALGLPEEYDAEDVERVAGSMLSKGIATTGIDQLSDMEKAEARLRSAAVAAASEIGPALAIGIDAANDEVADILLPLKQATVRAILEAVKLNEKHKLAVLAIQSAGLSFGNIGAMNWSSQPFNPNIFRTLASGWLADGSLEANDLIGLENLLG